MNIELNRQKVNSIVITELYYFISKYYNDITLADYIMNIFSIEKENIISSDISFDKFLKMLKYLQTMSNDQQICYNAGRYFTENRLFKGLDIPGARFSLRMTFRKIDKILTYIFPNLEITFDSLKKGSIIISIVNKDSAVKSDYYFAEYIKGVVSAIPGHWDLPSAYADIKAYPFSIEDILNIVDVPFSKKNKGYIIYDKEIVKERIINGNKDSSDEYEQSVLEDLYIKDIFIKKDTVLNSASLNMNIRWRNINFVKVSLFSFLVIIPIPISLLFLSMDFDYMIQLLNLGLFFLYETALSLFYNIYRRRDLKKIYMNMEENLLAELSEQRRITGEAINSTINRVHSIENLMEITKKILHEKNIVNLFDNIRKLTAKALNADRATVFIHDSENKMLSSGPELSEEKKEFKIPEDKGIAGEIFKLRRIVNVKDAYNNPNFNKSVDRQTGYETKTILGAPLLDLEDNLIGVIQVLNKRGGEFQQLDEQIIETLSTYIATALKDTITIRRLQERGIDPDIIKGLSTIIKYIFQEYSIIYDKVADVKNIPKLLPKMNNISLLLNKLVFLFDEQYIAKENSVFIKDIISSLKLFIENSKDNKAILYDISSSLSESAEIALDVELLYKAAYEILLNSIESVGQKGRIWIHIYNFVEVPNVMVHDFSIHDLILDFNCLSKENSNGFIDFLKSRKPFLESDLNRLRESMKEYIAFDFFDTGEFIDNEIKSKIFYPFFSTRNHFGLGLATAKTAVSRMGGMIEGPRNTKEGKGMQLLIPLK